MNEIKLKVKIVEDDYTKFVCQNFDIQNTEESEVTIPMNMGEGKTFEWNIGLIYGPSGCGKSVILNELGKPLAYNFSKEKALISNFSWLSPEEASQLLSSMGLSSIPTWLRPFHLLSNGEQARAMLAYTVSKTEGVILIDEFTSVVDRNVAKAMSNSLQKYIRKHKKKIVLASCHYDIVEWLQPDWTYSPVDGSFEKKESTLNQKLSFRFIESSMILGSSLKNIII